MSYKFMGKRRNLVLIMAMVLVVCCMTACNNVPITLNGRLFVLEQGNDIPMDVTLYAGGDATELAKCTLDVSAVNKDIIGEYDAAVIHPNKQFNFKIKIVDTTAPEVVLSVTELTVEAGSVIPVEKFVLSSQDGTSYTLGFADDITKADSEKVLLNTITYNTAGTYNAEVCAKDVYGNITVKPVVIAVTAKAADNSGNAGSTTAGENSQTEPQTESQTEPQTEPQTESQTDEKSTEEASKEPENTTQAPSQATETLNPASQITVGDFSQYSTDNVPFGFGNNLDPDTNRPTGLDWYVNKFGKYSVDFIQPVSNYIYLTFDEGYEYGFTNQILDTLKEKNVKAVFFITLPYAKENPELVRRIIDEGHVLGNHSATHPADGLASLSVEKQMEELNRVTDYVKENFNYDMYLFRYPTGAFSEQSLAIVQSLGYRAVFWSYAHKDWLVDDQPDVAEALEKAVNRAHGGAIYLLHAVSSTNTTMLPDFIDRCRALGYEFGYYSKTN